MAMQPQRWSISALSVELGMDRRTIAKRLADLRPIAEENGVKYYSLRDALKYLGLIKSQTLEEGNWETFVSESLPSFYEGLARDLAIIMKVKTDLSSSEIWSIFQDGFSAVHEMVRETLKDTVEDLPDDFQVSPPSFMFDLADPKRRKKLYKKLDRESASIKVEDLKSRRAEIAELYSEFKP